MTWEFGITSNCAFHDYKILMYVNLDFFMEGLNINNSQIDQMTIQNKNQDVGYLF